MVTITHGGRVVELPPDISNAGGPAIEAWLAAQAASAPPAEAPAKASTSRRAAPAKEE